MRKRVVIIGAGLAGLSAAYHLEKQGFTDYLTLEKDSEVGGLCKSFRINGFTFDFAPHIFYTKDRYVEGLIKNVLLLRSNFRSEVRKSFVYYRGVYTEYPFQANLYGQHPDIIKECLVGLIKARYESRINPRNFEEWIYATFGEGIGKHFMIPYNRKQWAIDLKKMDYDWIVDRVPIPEIENVLDGALKPAQKRYGQNAYFGYPLRGGMGSLPKGFLPHIRDLRLNSEVYNISLGRSEIEVNDLRIRYDSLISTIPLPTLVSLIEDVPTEVEKAAKDLQYNIVYTVNLGIDGPNISDYHWVYFPEDKYIFQRISFPTNLSPFVAPKGKSSITAEVSASKYKPLKVDEERLADVVINDLIKANLLKETHTILFKDVKVLNPAYIIYNCRRGRNVKIIHQFLRKNRIYPCGRFGEWEYLNMDHSILSGRRGARKAINASR